MNYKNIIFAFLGFLVGYFAKNQQWFDRDEPKNYSEKTNSDAAEAPPLPSIDEDGEPDANSANQNNLVSPTGGPASSDDSIATTNFASRKVVDLQRLSQIDLFNALYILEVLKEKQNHTEYFEKIKTRLTSPYPITQASVHRSNYEKEVANRLGLLRAMAKYWPSSKEVKYDHKKIKDFFRSVAENKIENLMIRRQAYKNWLSFGDTVSTKEKSKFSSENSSQLLHLVSLSDQSLIEELTESTD